MNTTITDINLDSELQVLCDPDSSRLASFTEKFHAFRNSLEPEEKDYLDFIRRAADVAAAQHGTALISDIDAFEEEIEAILGDDYVTPEMGGLVIRTTVAVRCATWLLKC